MPGKLAGGDLGGIYLRNGGRVIHVHIVSQLLNCKASTSCFQPPHRVMKTTGHPAQRSPKFAQLKQAAEPFDMYPVIG